MREGMRDRKASAMVDVSDVTTVVSALSGIAVTLGFPFVLLQLRQNGKLVEASHRQIEAMITQNRTQGLHPGEMEPGGARGSRLLRTRTPRARAALGASSRVPQYRPERRVSSCPWGNQYI